MGPFEFDGRRDQGTIDKRETQSNRRKCDFCFLLTGCLQCWETFQCFTFHGLESSHRRVSSFGRYLGAQDREWPGNCDYNMLWQCHYLLIFVLIESHNHRIHWVGRDPSGSLSPLPVPSHNTPRVTSCAWEHCPDASWMQPRLGAGITTVVCPLDASEYPAL